jgi:hypothetical protein
MRNYLHNFQTPNFLRFVKSRLASLRLLLQPHGCCILRLLGPMTLAETDACAAAVLVDEVDTGQPEGPLPGTKLGGYAAKIVCL